MSPNAIELEIVTPAGVVVRESVDEVEAPGVEGHFGVLPGHRPFMSQLRAGQLRYRTGKENHFVAVHWGFAEVLPNKVTVLVETAERAEDIESAARRDREAAGGRASQAVRNRLRGRDRPCRGRARASPPRSRRPRSEAPTVPIKANKGL